MIDFGYLNAKVEVYILMHEAYHDAAGAKGISNQMRRILSLP